jgi:hypothetical protein
VYSGSHFPRDILGGWLTGSLLLCVYFFAGKRVEALIAKHGPRAGMIACAAIAFAMILYNPSLGGTPLEGASAELVMPAGLLLGMGTGYFLRRKYIGKAAGRAADSSNTKKSMQEETFGTIRRTALLLTKYTALFSRCILGAIVMVLLYRLTGNIVNDFTQDGNYHLYIFLRFVLIALWVTAGAPWIFTILYIGNTHDSIR